MLDFPSLLYKGLRILMFQLSGVYCTFIEFMRAFLLLGIICWGVSGSGGEFGLGRLGFRGI